MEFEPSTWTIEPSRLANFSDRMSVIWHLHFINLLVQTGTYFSHSAVIFHHATYIGNGTHVVRTANYYSLLPRMRNEKIQTLFSLWCVMWQFNITSMNKVFGLRLTSYSLSWCCILCNGMNTVCISYISDILVICFRPTKGKCPNVALMLATVCDDDPALGKRIVLDWLATVTYKVQGPIPLRFLKLRLS